MFNIFSEKKNLCFFTKCFFLINIYVYSQNINIIEYFLQEKDLCFFHWIFFTKYYVVSIRI